jgi:Pentapeptide repeats (8 copies)
LQGADLSTAQLQNAYLALAQLQGADLRDARLQGSTFAYAELQGADLVEAQLQGADLLEAELEGADLGYAELQGANLVRAQLQGSDLGDSELQGANLLSAQLADTEFDGAFVFRSNIIDNGTLAMMAVRSVRAGKVKSGGGNIESELNDADVGEWIAAATQFAAPRDEKRIRDQFERLKLNPGFQTSEQDAADEAKWAELTKQSRASDPEGANHRQRLATILGDLACNRVYAPYVARRLIGDPKHFDPGRVGRPAAQSAQSDGGRAQERGDLPRCCRVHRRGLAQA